MVDSERTRVLRLPNEIRVAGFLLLLQDILSSFHITCEHGDDNQNFKSLALPHVAWQ